MSQVVSWEELRLNLFSADLVCTALHPIIESKGPLKAWYRASRKPVSGGQREVNWFLTDTCLIRQEINPDELFFVLFELQHMIRTEKHYDYLNGNPRLKRIILTFVDGKTCDLLVPYQQFQGDMAGFEKMVSLLV